MCSIDTIAFSKYIDKSEYKDAIGAIVFGNKRVFEDTSVIHYRTSFMEVAYDEQDESVPNSTMSMVSYKGGTIEGITIPRIIEHRIIFVISKISPSLVVVTDSKIFKKIIIAKSLSNTSNNKCHIDILFDIIINHLKYTITQINDVIRIVYSIKMIIPETTFYSSQKFIVILDMINKIIWLYQNMMLRIEIIVKQAKELTIYDDTESRGVTISSLISESNNLLENLSKTSYNVADYVIKRAQFRNNITLRSLTIISFIFLPTTFLINYIAFYRKNLREGFDNTSVIIISLLMIFISLMFREDFIKLFSGIFVN